MPRKAKDKEEIIEEKKINKKNTTKKTVAKKSSTAKSTVAKKTTTVKKKTTVAKKATTKKEETKPKKEVKKNTAKKTSTKKVVEKKPEKKSTKTTKNTKKTATKVKKATTKENSKSKKVEVVEYYDLPYRYNKTIVKVLAQTPEILFVYWDISDEDKQNYINQYGEFFFNDTKPVLIVYNDTMKYCFEVDINDFANSWYLHIKDSNCDYRVELGRRPINKYAKINDFLSIASSNEMDAPNDHILFDSLNKIVYFRNVKTNITSGKDISLSFLTKIGKLYNVKEFYKKLYKDENIDFEKLNLKNMPSS